VYQSPYLKGSAEKYLSKTSILGIILFHALSASPVEVLNRVFCEQQYQLITMFEQIFSEHTFLVQLFGHFD
jgi:hypothetical protein